MGKGEKEDASKDVMHETTDPLTEDLLDLVWQYAEDVAALELARQEREGIRVENDEEVLTLFALGPQACFAARGIENLCVGVVNPDAQIADIVVGLGLLRQEDRRSYAFPNPLTQKALHIALDTILVRGKIIDTPLPADPGADAFVLQYQSLMPTRSSYVMVLTHPLVDTMQPTVSFVPQAISGRQRAI